MLTRIVKQVNDLYQGVGLRYIVLSEVVDDEVQPGLGYHIHERRQNLRREQLMKALMGVNVYLQGSLSVPEDHEVVFDQVLPEGEA